jgi:5'-3' exonuclease
MSDKFNLILIDTSYTSFYRFFATLRWLSLSNPDEYKLYKNDATYDWTTNKTFIEKYEKMYFESIVKLIKKKQMKQSIVIFCMDAPRETLWRNKLLPTYKAGRADISLKHNITPVFKYTYDTIIPNILINANMYSLKIPQMEADDIIACITMYNTDHRIIIVSGDNDFLQLGKYNVSFINYKLKKLIQIDSKSAFDKLQEKIIMGDKSDNILPIVSNKKKLKEFMKDINLIKEHPEIYTKYKQNSLLIDFNNIPKEYYDKVITKFVKLFIKQ